MKINITVGDWSKDGHNQSDEYVIESNLKVSEINAAYKKGSKTVGFDLVKDVATDYEENGIKNEYVEGMLKFYPEYFYHKPYKGPLIAKNENPDDDFIGGFEDGPETYLRVYLEIVRLGNPEFKYKILNDKNPTINLGGYGLYN